MRLLKIPSDDLFLGVMDCLEQGAVSSRPQGSGLKVAGLGQLLQYMGECSCF